MTDVMSTIAYLAHSCRKPIELTEAASAKLTDVR